MDADEIEGNLDGSDLDGENLDGGDLADEDEGHHDAKAKSKAAETSSQSKQSKRWADEKTKIEHFVRKKQSMLHLK